MGELKVLPSGKSVTLRHPDDVSERLRRPIRQAMLRVRGEIMEAGRNAASAWQNATTPEEKKAAETTMMALPSQMTEDEREADALGTDLGIVALVEGWEYEQPISVEGLLDLPGRDYDALRKLVQPLVNDLFVDASPDPNPGAPTGGSNGSATHSTEAARTTSLPSGGPTASSESG